MNPLIRYFSVFLLTVGLVPLVYADSKDSGKAIIAASETLGFQLSKKASETIGIKIGLVEGNGNYTVPKQALVRFQNHIGIYRVRENWIKLILVRVKAETNSTYIIQTNDLQKADHVVIQGVPLLRIADLDAHGGVEEGE
ncbi:MAG: hypothetical protein HYX35_04880 [Proteobacteria bacterium]|nr:hypothetical protein [Pseudomonadota bacterium]